MNLIVEFVNNKPILVMPVSEYNIETLIRHQIKTIFKLMRLNEFIDDPFIYSDAGSYIINKILKNTDDNTSDYFCSNYLVNNVEYKLLNLKKIIFSLTCGGKFQNDVIKQIDLKYLKPICCDIDNIPLYDISHFTNIIYILTNFLVKHFDDLIY